MSVSCQRNSVHMSFLLEELLVSFLNLCLHCSNQLVQTSSVKVSPLLPLRIQLWLRRPKFALGPTPSRSAHRVDLSTGVPEYKAYLESISWAIRCGLRHCGRDNTNVYYGSQTRKFPKAIWPAVIKVKPDSVPLYLGHQTVSAYFPFGETAATRLIEGQLAFLHHVRNYEDAHPGTRLLQRNLCWKIEFLNCCLGALPAAQLNEIAASIEEIAALKGQPKTMDGQ